MSASCSTGGAGAARGGRVQARWCTGVCYAPRLLFDARRLTPDLRFGGAFFAAADFAVRFEGRSDFERALTALDFFFVRALDA
jgi:hypothetical protein